ncbi:MAG: hypothetical protein ACQEQZ_04975 [Pseudomonadota bacterium]
MRWQWPIVGVVVLLISADTVLDEQQRRWLASFKGEPQEQHDTAKVLWQQQQSGAALYWWQKAVANGSVKALQRLLHHYPAQHVRWHRLAAGAGIASAVAAYAEFQLADKRISWNNWMQRWYQPEYRQPLADYFSVIERWISNPACRSSIPVKASSPTQKKQFMTLLQQLDNTSLPLTGLCFQFSVNPKLDCDLDNENQRAECVNQPPIAAAEKPQQPTVILAQRGKASTSANHITLTRDSDARVLIHELGHWWGFADEYAMAPPLAENFCYGRYNFDAYNVVLTQSDQMTGRQLKTLWQSLPWASAVADWRALGKRGDDGLWQLGSSPEQPVGLFPAATCEHVPGVTAWKPVSAVTAMERHQSQYWPPLYRRWIKAHTAKAN